MYVSHCFFRFRSFHVRSFPSPSQHIITHARALVCFHSLVVLSSSVTHKHTRPTICYPSSSIHHPAQKSPPPTKSPPCLILPSSAQEEAPTAQPSHPPLIYTQSRPPSAPLFLLLIPRDASSRGGRRGAGGGSAGRGGVDHVPDAVRDGRNDMSGKKDDGEQ